MEDVSSKVINMLRQNETYLNLAAKWAANSLGLLNMVRPLINKRLRSIGMNV